MDRAAFLRASNYLIPLPPRVWESAVGGTSHDDGNNNDEVYSGSTITPPTPSRHTIATLRLFNDLNCVVSIETSVFLKEDEVGEGDSTNNNDDGGNSSRTTKGNNYRRDQINSDPSLCTFEAAIVQEDALSLFSNYPEERSKKIDYHDTMIEIRESKRKVLLFRFGHRFVFRVDDSAIVEIRYEPGSDLDDYTTIDNQNGDDKSPLSKRQKLDSGRPSSTAAENGSAKTTTRRQLPPSMLVSFYTCSFRVFSLDKQNVGSSKSIDVTMEDMNRPSSRIWSTLKPKVAETSVENTLMNSRSVLLQHFDIANNQRRGRPGCPKLWKMAPPGSGLAFHTWPEESFDGSRLHQATTLSKASCENDNFLSEGWDRCLDMGNQEMVECPSSVTTSPRKSGSASKSSGSSTHFEHGQKELIPTSSLSQSQSTKSAVESSAGTKERASASDQLSSELSHETKQCDDDEGGGDGKPNGSQPSTVHEMGNNLVASEKTNNDVCTNENGEENHGGTSQIENGTTRRGEEDMDFDQKGANQHQLWKDELCKKYKSYDQSATHMDKAMEAKTFAVSTQHLTSCADSLSASYLSINEFTTRSQECEDDVNRISTELESVLDMMFPARGGRKSNEALTYEKSREFQLKIEELVSLRKEAVAEKLALLLMPKR
ncbi:hypothetical protein ACHAXH_010024 [Discostella pseudostelligera]